jgi:hypothetical protein
MQIEITPSQNLVNVNGVSAHVNCASIAQDIETIRYNTAGQIGDITRNGQTHGIGARDFQPFERYVNQWLAATSPASMTLAQAKQYAHDQINSARDSLEQSGFMFMGQMLDSDAISVARMTTTVQAAQVAVAAGQEFNIGWTTQANTVLNLTATQIMQMPLALALHANTLHLHARDKKTQIDAATTLAEVEAITW